MLHHTPHSGHVEEKCHKNFYDIMPQKLGPFKKGLPLEMGPLWRHATRTGTFYDVMPQELGPFKKAPPLRTGTFYDVMPQELGPYMTSCHKNWDLLKRGSPYLPHTLDTLDIVVHTWLDHIPQHRRWGRSAGYFCGGREGPRGWGDEAVAMFQWEKCVEFKSPILPAKKVRRI